MSIETLNLLSDSTFGDKLDEQNAILEDIRDNISGGSVPDATTSSKGIVQIGDNINVNAGVISVPSATTSSKGAVQIGDNINVSNGEISVADATTSTKGVVQLASSVASGDTTHVPTANAVYQAVQGAGSRYLFPTPQESWTDTADCFISSSSSGSVIASQILPSAQMVKGSKLFRSNSNSLRILWIKGSLLGNYANSNEAFSNVDINIIPLSSLHTYITNFALITIQTSNIEYLTIVFNNIDSYLSVKI